ADEDAPSLVDPDRLSTAKRAIGLHDGVPHFCKPCPRRLRIAALDLQYTRIRKGPRGVERLLRVHAEIEEVGDDMGMPHRLKGTAHDAERHDDLAAMAEHRRDDRMHRPLAARRLVRMPLGEGEARTAVLEEDAELLRRNAGAETPVDRVDH